MYLIPQISDSAGKIRIVKSKNDLTPFLEEPSTVHPFRSITNNIYYDAKMSTISGCQLDASIIGSDSNKFKNGVCYEQTSSIRGHFRKTIQISKLLTKELNWPIKIFVEPDDKGFIAKTLNLPLYSYGDTENEAISNMKHEIESLYNDLIEDDNFTDEWFVVKNYLTRIVNSD